MDGIFFFCGATTKIRPRLPRSVCYNTQFQTRTSSETSVNELLSRRRDLLSTSHKNQEMKIMPPAGFKLAIPKIERSQGYLP